MCWVMITAGESAGRLTSTSLVASVPPVEAPMKMIFGRHPPEQAMVRRAGAGACAGAPGRGCSDARGGSAPGGDADLVGDVLRQLAQAVGHADLGLGDEVDGAQLQRRSVTSAPRSVSVETITTGIGRRRIRRDRKSSPSMRHLDVERDDVRG